MAEGETDRGDLLDAANLYDSTEELLYAVLMKLHLMTAAVLEPLWLHMAP